MESTSASAPAKAFAVYVCSRSSPTSAPERWRAPPMKSDARSLHQGIGLQPKPVRQGAEPHLRAHPPRHSVRKQQRRGPRDQRRIDHPHPDDHGAQARGGQPGHQPGCGSPGAERDNDHVGLR